MIFNRRCFFASLLVFVLSNAVFADFDAAAFVNQFNSGGGLKFTASTSSSEAQVNFSTGYSADLSAYVRDNTSGTANTAGTYFRTFCIEPGVSASGNLFGNLSYNGSTSTVSSSNSSYNGKTVNLGTAVLYSQFTSKNLSDYVYVGSNKSDSAKALQAALQATMGITPVSNWSSNVFLNHLLSINSSQSYWMSAYNPNNYYSEVGNYAVFAMNVTSGSGGAGSNMQDFLYVTAADYSGGGPPGVVPEPATMLFWSLGGLTFLGTKLRRRK